jgi:ribosomal protein S18 acetylase RimI-like enzyme
MLSGPAREDDLDFVVTLIVGEQARRERRCTYVGLDADGIRAELDALSPPWAETVRVVRDGGGTIVGVSVVEWDDELGRAWILGPWVAGDDAAWTGAAPVLLDAAIAQLPSAVTRHELSGEVDHGLLGRLAADRGWAASEVNHALVIDEATVAGWLDELPAGVLREAVPADEPAIAEMHDDEFPGTYASAAQLASGESERIVLVVPGRDGDATALSGYAAGQVHADGEGFIDFVVVHPTARGRGVGRHLVIALTRKLLAASTTGTVALTVQDRRVPARALYEQLGFRPDAAIVAYRNWDP